MNGMSNAKADGETKRVVWILAGIMMLSFIFGIGMFIPAEHRTEKLDEMMQRYQARRPGTDQKKPTPKKRISF